MSKGNRGACEILYVWPYLDWGGVQIYFAGIMKLARERYTVRVVMPAGSAERLLSYMERLGVPCEFFDAHIDSSPALSVWHKIRRRWRKARCEFVIARHLSKRHPLKRSILHMDFGPWSSFWLLLYLSLRSNVLVTLHIALPSELSWIRYIEWRLKFMILCSVQGFHLLASNRDMQHSLSPYVPRRFMQEVRVAYSGIDPEEIKQALEVDFDRAALCEKYGLPASRFLVFSLGQMVERKGYRVLLEAARRFQRVEGEAPYFVWVGTATRNPEIEARIDEYGLRDSFRAITSAEIGASRHDLLMLLRLADLFALPSLSEGLPVSLVEMMALGKACIASNINAIPEAIKDHETGMLVEPGDPLALADAIAKLLANQALRERLAAAAQTYALAHFDERIAARTTLDYYDACCQAV